MTIIFIVAIVAIVGMIDGRIRWGKDYWKYGSQECAVRALEQELLARIDEELRK